MKKIYFLFLLSCLSYVVNAQTTVVLYATGATGSYITGNANSFGTRADNNIVSTTGFATSRGYAVFDLSTLPPGTAITSCIIGFNVSNYAGTGTPAGWATYGFAGDLSTITTAATLYADMIAGTLLTNVSYGTAAGDRTLPSAAATTSFLQSQLGNIVSICWTGGASRVYNITGEAGTATTVSSGTPGHAPYLQITYTCAGISGVSALASPSPVCEGSTATLTGNATGASTYSWAGPGGFTSTLQNPSFAASASSGGTYTFTAYNSAGCATEATTSLAVSAAPVATVTASGNLVFCAGGNVVLSVPAGNSYQWYESGSAISGETSNTYTATTAGSFSVVVTGSNGCSATSAAVATGVLPVTPLLSPAGAVDICIGANTTLSVGTGGLTTGVTYQWMVDSAVISGATAATYVAGVSGSYFVILSVTGCSDTSTSTQVTLNPPPNPVVSFNSHTGLLYTSSSYATYQWFVNSVAIPGATSYTYSPTEIGSYRVVVTDPHGCSNFSAPLILNALAVNKLAVPEVSIFPNPATNELHITTTVTVRAVISSIEGKQIMDKAEAKDIDVSGLAQGLYLITLYNDAGDRIAIRKFTKE